MKTDPSIISPLIVAVLTQLFAFNPQPLHAQSPSPDDFNPGANEQVLCLAVQADGKVLVGGRFSTLGGQPRNSLGRLNPDGTVDPSFNPGAGGSNPSVVTLALQADGKILVGGGFGTLGGQPRNNLGRLNPDGTLDPTFNPGAVNGSVFSLAVQVDGKILAGGAFITLGGQPYIYIGRLNPDGTLDSTFNAGANSTISSVALQVDGKILVGGYFATLGGQPRNRIGRLNPDGTLDTLFNPGANERVYCLVLQADGKILVGGGFTTLGEQPRNRIGRLNPDGTLDPTFNPGANNWVYSLGLQVDGKILVGGSFATLGGQPRSRIARLNNTGPASQTLTNDGATITWLRGGTSPEVWRTTFEHSLDGSNWIFLGAGTRIASGWQLTGLSLPPDGTLRARGYAAGGDRNASGWFVDSYAGRPIFFSQPANRTNDAGASARFEVAASGSEPLSYQWFKDATPLANQANVAGATSSMLTVSGVLGPDEGGYRVVVSNLFGSVTSTVATLTVMDPFILAPPMGTNLNVGESVTLNVTVEGTPPFDYQWHHDGLAVPGATGSTLAFTGLSGADAGYYTVQVSNVFGSVTSSPVSLTVNLATTEAGFNPGVGGCWGEDCEPSVSALAVQTDGKVLIGGYFSRLGGQPRNSLARLNSDGTLDSAFNPQPGEVSEDGDSGPSVNSLAVQPDGKILVGGSFTTLSGQPCYNLGRLNPDGTLDSTFNPGANDSVYCLALQTDGRILVGGYFNTLAGQPRKGIGRLNPDGTLDSTFDPGTGGSYPYVYCLVVQADGRILVGGYFSTLGGQPRNYLGRLNPDGTLDASFNPAADGAYPNVFSLALQADGKILVGGYFTTLGGQPRNNLGRLNPDGTLDSTFNPGSGGYAPNVRSLALQADGRILVGGDFSTLGGQPRSRIGRLNPDGIVDSTFNPGVGAGGWDDYDTVASLAVQADGKILVGGRFTSVDGQLRGRIARLNNTAPASQTLTNDGSTITWRRSGTSPEVWRTTFEHSSDGSDWTFLGAGTRIPGGWQLTGVSLLPEGTLRAQGYAAGGERNASGWFMESYAGRLLFVSQPASRTNDAGTTARFEASAGGTEPLSYQWFKGATPLANQGNVAGATSPALTVSGVLEADEGAYRVVVSDASGSVTSTVATLTVRDPVILVPPIGTNRNVGESVTLSATAGGTPPLNYQWYHDGLAVPGATGPALTFHSLSGADAGDYTVQVINVHGSVSSPPVSLTVNLATTDADFNPGADGSILSLALQADGKIVVGGYFAWLGGQPRNNLGRLNSDGTPDFTFNPGVGGSYPHVSCLAVQADGKILVGGYFTTLGGQPRNNLGRLNPDGALDSTFNPGANHEVRSLAVQADGRILVGGEFGTLGGQPRNYLGRLDPNGTLDSTFNPEPNDWFYSLAVQADGKILISGAFGTLAGQPRNSLGRLNPDGTLDSTFDPVAGGSVYSLAVQADGKILVGGESITLGGQPRSALGRLNPDGTLDSTFNPEVEGGEDDPSVSSLAVQADGKILVGGYFTTLGGQPRNSVGRLNPDGTPDSTFNAGANGGVYSLALQADGKILVGGWFSALGGQSAIRLGRLNNTGPASQTLTSDGATVTWLRGGTSPEVWRTTFEHSSDGSVWTFLGAGTRIAGGWQLSGLSLPAEVALRARGYAAGGYGNASSWFMESYAGRLLLLSQPASLTNDAGTTARFEVVAGGTEPLGYQWFKGATPLANQGNVAGATSRTLTMSGVLKPDEGGYRVVVSDAFGSLTSTVATLTVRDPVILVPPTGTNRTMGQSVALNVTAAGTPPLNYQWYHDGLAVPGAIGSALTFSSLSGADVGYYAVQVSNAQGSVSSSPVLVTGNVLNADADFDPGADDPVLSLAVQADGKILVGGYFTTLGGQPRSRIGRLNPDGTLDSTFNPGAGGFSPYVGSIALQADGKIVVGGYFTWLGGQPRNFIGRLHPDGTLDPKFNPAANDWVSSLAVQADGRILVGGRFTTLGGQPRNCLGRLNPDGTLDSTFNPGVGGSNPSVSSLALQPDGKILVGGSFAALGGQPRTCLGRLNPDGTLDPTFNPGANNGVYSLALQADGKILVGGFFTSLGGQPRNYLGRLNPDGTLDATFNPGADWYVLSLALQADGKILVGGRFTTLGGQPRNRIGRLNPDGTLDSTFNPGAGSSVSSLALQADGKILVGGYFTTLGGQPRNDLGRVSNNGPARQSLIYDGATITWLRGGTSPEVWRSTFDHSTDGLTWTSLGAGARISGGWQLTGVSLPPNGAIRARGYVTGGDNASGWFVESTLTNAPALRLTIIREGLNVLLSWTGGQGPYQVQQTTELSPSNVWQNVGAPLHTNAVSIPIGVGPKFLRVLGQ